MAEIPDSSRCGGMRLGFYQLEAIRAGTPLQTGTTEACGITACGTLCTIRPSLSGPEHPGVATTLGPDNLERCLLKQLAEAAAMDSIGAAVEEYHRQKD